LLLFQYKSGMILVSKKGLLFLALLGVAAFCTDYFALRMFASDFPLSVGGPILIGGSVALASIIGFFLGETITIQAVAGVVLVTIGAALLSTVAR